MEPELTKKEGSASGSSPVNRSHMGDLKNNVVVSDFSLTLKYSEQMSISTPALCDKE